MNKIALLLVTTLLAASGAASASTSSNVTCQDMARVADFIKVSHDDGRPYNRVKNLVSQEKVGPYTRQTYQMMVDTVYYSKGWPQNYSESVYTACLAAVIAERRQ